MNDEDGSYWDTARGESGTTGWRAPEAIRSGFMEPQENSDSSNTHQSKIGESIDSKKKTQVSEMTNSSNASLNSSHSLSSMTRLGKSIDVFSAGLVFYYTLTKGGHPYGLDRYVREHRILTVTPSLEAVFQMDPLGISLYIV